MQIYILPLIPQKHSGKRVESKIKHILKKKIFKKFYLKQQSFLIGLIEFYERNNYLTDKQYYWLDKYYTVSREKF